MTLKEKILEVMGGPHPAAVATLDGKMPAVRFMVLAGFPDMILVGGTIKSSRKVEQLMKNPETAISDLVGERVLRSLRGNQGKGKSPRRHFNQKEILEPDV